MIENIEIPDEWYREHTVPELITLRDNFIYVLHNWEYTCYKCLNVTKCALAYDAYNTNGECLFEK